MIGRFRGVVTASHSMLIKVPRRQVDCRSSEICRINLDGGCAPKLFPDRGILGMCYQALGKLADVFYRVLTASKTASAPEQMKMQAEESSCGMARQSHRSPRSTSQSPTLPTDPPPRAAAMRTPPPPPTTGYPARRAM